MVFEKIYMSLDQAFSRIYMGSKNVLLLFFILLFAGLPSVHAQAGLYVSQHNITYRLFDSHYLVEEKIVFAEGLI